MKKSRSPHAVPLYTTAKKNASLRNVVAIDMPAFRAIRKRGGSSLLLRYGPPQAPTNSGGSDQRVDPTLTFEPDQSSSALLRLKGHKPGCITLRKSGRIASCDCKRSPIDDPAFAVGMIIHYGRMAMAQRAPLPPVVLELLSQRLNEGDPTCKVVAKWLERSRMIRITTTLRQTSSKGGRK